MQLVYDSLFLFDIQIRKVKNEREKMSSENVNVLTAAKLENQETAIKTKKISFLSAIFIVIGSCIGSGIFFKASSILSNSWYSLPIAIVSWVLSSIAVICMSLSLIEVTSKRSSNLSIIGWVKNFSSKFMYKTCKNFMFYIYMPLTFFFMPIYSIQGFMDALDAFGVQNNFNTANDWAIWSIIGLLISFWFILTSGLSTKWGNVQNWLITCVKFFPLAIVTILGFYIASVNGTQVSVEPIVPSGQGLSFVSLSPGIGMFLSFGAIFFAYDGFYYSVGIQTDMKQPEKTSKALVIGLVIVTAIYLLIAISMSIANKEGSFSSFIDFLRERNLSWIAGVTNILIAIGVLGIINSFAMWSTRFTEDLINAFELPLSDKYYTKTNTNKPMVGTIYVLIVTTVLYVIFAIIGGLAYTPSSYMDNGQSLYDGANYYSMARLLGFSDLMANWTSVFAFAYIVVSITGCMKKRKNDNEIKKTKFFMPTAIISSILISLGLLFQTAAPFVDVILLFKPENYQDVDTIISRVMLIVVLLIFIALMIIPSYFDKDSKFFNKLNKKTI